MLQGVYLILHIDLCLGIFTELVFCFRSYVTTFAHFFGDFGIQNHVVPERCQLSSSL